MSLFYAKILDNDKSAITFVAKKKRYTFQRKSYFISGNSI